MQTIILAAGNNTRFDGVHKSTLEAPDGRTVLEYQVERIDANPLIIIAQKKYLGTLKNPVHRLSYMKGKARTIVHKWLPEETSGPLDTLFKAKKIISWLKDDEPVLVLYSDIIPSKKCVGEFIKEATGTHARVFIFKSDNDRFQESPVDGFVLGGMFYFKSPRYLEYLMKTINEEMLGPENGISDLVFKAASPHVILGKYDFVDIGTPESYKEWINE